MNPVLVRIRHMEHDMPPDKDFVSLLMSHREPLWAFIRAMVRDYHACEDIFQQVTMILWEQFPKFERGTSFIAWSRAIATRATARR